MSGVGDRLLIVGGGLTGSLIALGLSRLRPDTDFLLVEKAGRFGGGPVSPFFLDALGDVERAMIEPLIVAEWPSHHIAFPHFGRIFPGRVAYLVPEQVHAEVIQTVPAARYRAGAEAVAGNDTAVQLASGEVLSGRLVIDTRGDLLLPGLTSHCAYSRNQLVRCLEPHGLERPVLVDATVAVEAWSFLQYFPLAANLLLIRYVGHAREGAIAPPPEPEDISAHGRLLADYSTIDPLTALNSHEGPWTRVRGAACAPFHPILASPAAGAAALATLVARRARSGIDELRRSVAELEESIGVQRMMMASILDALLDDNPIVRRAALRCLYRAAPETIARTNAGCAEAGELARLGAATEAARARVGAMGLGVEQDWPRNAVDI